MYIRVQEKIENVIQGEVAEYRGGGGGNRHVVRCLFGKCDSNEVQRLAQEVANRQFQRFIARYKPVTDDRRKRNSADEGQKLKTKKQILLTEIWPKVKRDINSGKK